MVVETDSPPKPVPAAMPPPALPPRPDLGRFMMSAGFIVRPTQFLEAAHAQCGDYFTLLPSRDRVLVVTVDPAAVKRVFTGDPAQLYAGEANIILAPLLGQRSVLLLDGAGHLRQRKLMLPPFHGERMRGYGETIAAVARREVASWPRDQEFAVLPSMQAITLEVIMRVVFGMREDAGRERMAGPLRRQLDMLASRRQVLLLALAGNRTGPRSPWAKMTAARREADALIYEQIRAGRDDGGSDDDIFSLLLAARDEDGQPMSDTELRDELMTLLVAGHETTATALAWTLERVVRHPDVLARLQADPDDDAYLDAVIKETLRLRPVVPAVARRLQVPMEFGGWQLPAGVHIAPSIYLLHRRPDIYPEPLAFKPTRFLGDGAPGTYEWIPFGGGVRRCLGASFALFEMRVVLREMLRGVRLEPVSRGRPRLRARANGSGGESVTRRAITFAPTQGGRVAVRSQPAPLASG